MSFRDFDAALADAAGEPITFKLGGDTFTVPRPVPAHATLRLMSDPNVSAIVGFFNYISDVLVEDQREAFKVAFKESGIDETRVIELATWITEEATGVPTERRPSLARSPRTNGKRSKVGSSAPGTTGTA